MSEYNCTKVDEIATLKSNQNNNMESVRELRKEVADLRNIYKLIYELTSNFTTLSQQMNDTRKDLKCIKDDVEIIKNLPNDRENHLIKVVLGAIIILIVGAMWKVFIGGI